MASHSDYPYQAAQLIHFGLQARQRPAQEPEYQNLVTLYLDRSDFRCTVKEIARGLYLVVLEVSEHGIVLAPLEGSAFALKPAEFRPTGATADERFLDGLVQLAIAATIFPRARDLDEEATRARPPVTIEEVDTTLRTICERYEREQKSQPDPALAIEEAGLHEAWRVYQRRLSVMETGDGRKAARSARRIIEFGLDRLREFGCFVKESRAGQSWYQPTWRYQILVRELAADAVYRRITELLEKD
jgi:hypothetical protein